MNFLNTIAKKYKTDKNQHCYIPFYASLFDNILQTTNCILEIGVLSGESIKMWAEYFPNAKIVGVDFKDMSQLNNDQITCIKGDINNNETLEKVFNVAKEFDIILDDGSHKMDDQQGVFGKLFKYVKKDGYYIIEDLHTSNLFYKKLGRHGLKEDFSNSSLRMIFKYLETNIIDSEYITQEERKYIQNKIKFVNLFSNNNNMSTTCVFKKK